MNRQLDASAAAMLRAELERRGMRFRMSAHRPPFSGRCEWPACSSMTAPRCRPTWWSLAVGIASRNLAGAALPVCAASAASWSTTRCRPSIRRSMRWASACSIATALSDWSRQLMEQARVCAAHLAEQRRRSLWRLAAGHSAEGVRHPASIPPATTTATWAPKTWCCATNSRASTSAWCSRTTRCAARCSMATRATAAGTPT